jgi:hypothetical protein
VETPSAWRARASTVAEPVFAKRAKIIRTTATPEDRPVVAPML